MRGPFTHDYRGLDGGTLGLPERILAAAVSYQSACESRPYRDEMSPGAVGRRLGVRARAGELDPVAVEAVLHTAGLPADRANLRPDGLTPREIEVLCLVARGASNRIGASMYALRHGLVNSD